MPHRILVVDDDKQIVRLLRSYLEKAGFDVYVAYEGETALQEIRSQRPDLVVLDLMLPGRDGWEITRIVRADPQLQAMPIIMLTAQVEDTDKIVGLELGADDYIPKPFNPRELVARVKAILRRLDRQRYPAEGEHPQPVRLGNTVVDPAAREVTVDGQPVALRTQEFELLWVLVQHRNLVLSREQLLRLAWGYDFAGLTRTVDVHVAQLRKKLAGSDLRIETVTGVGYKLVA